MNDVMHHLIVSHRKAGTACGIRVIAHYPQSKTALPANADSTISAVQVPDHYGVEITCPRCRKAVGRAPLQVAS